MRKIRWGVLGAAGIARRAFIPAVARSGNGVVHAIASRDPGKARAVAAAASIPRAHGSYRDLLDDPEIDAVYLPLPNSLHAEWAIRCAAAGKPTLCEKPVARDAAEARRVVEAFAARGVTFSENFVYRFHPQTQHVKAMLDEGAVGEPRLIVASRSYATTEEGRISLSKELAGGALMDVGCYCVNALRHFAGEEPAGIQAAAEWGERSGVDETLAGLFRFPSGVIGHFDCSMRADLGNYYEIRGSRGRILVETGFSIPPAAPCTIHHWFDGRHRAIEVAPANQFLLLVEDFADALLHGRPPLLEPGEAVRNMEAIDALYAAAAPHQTAAPWAGGEMC